MQPPPISPAGAPPGAPPSPPAPPPGGPPAPPPGAPHLPPSEDEDEQMQQAIAASLIDHKVPDEDGDLQRALDASLQHPGMPKGHESQVGSYYIPAPSWLQPFGHG